jgi:hypothetical protein
VAQVRFLDSGIPDLISGLVSASAGGVFALAAAIATQVNLIPGRRLLRM